MIEIPLTQGMVAVVDDDDAERVLRHRWHAVRVHRCCYAATGAGDRRVYMHRMILGNVAGDIDHRNHDGLDNRRSNLRVAERRGLNIANARFPLGATGYRGVTVNRRSQVNPYIAQIKVKGQRITVGRFPVAEDAAIAYDRAARQHFGEFATLNFPDREG